MSKSERLQPKTQVEENQKTVRTANRGRVSHKSSKYDGGFIDLTNESSKENNKKDVRDREGLSRKEVSAKETSTKRASSKKTLGKKVKAKRELGRRPSEDGFFKGSKDDENKVIQTISIGKKAKKEEPDKRQISPKEEKKQDYIIENPEEFEILDEESWAPKFASLELDQGIDKSKSNTRQNIEKEKPDKEKSNKDKLSNGKSLAKGDVGGNGEERLNKIVPPTKDSIRRKVEENKTIENQQDDKISREKQKKNEQHSENISRKEQKADAQHNRNISKERQRTENPRSKKAPADSFGNWQEVEGDYSLRKEKKNNNLNEGKQIQGLLSQNTSNQNLATIEPINKELVSNEPIGKKPVSNEPVASKRKPRKPMSKRAKLILRASIPATLLLAIYIVGSIFYTSRFVERTFINGYEFSRAVPSEVSRFFENKGENYTIAIAGLGGLSEVITGEELQLSISDNGGVMELLEGQNSWAWPILLLSRTYHELDLLIDYCDASLSNRVDQIVCGDLERTIQPVDAKPYFNGDRFEIQEEVLGTLINPEILVSHIQTSMSVYGNTLDLVAIDAYIRPTVFSTNPELVASIDRLNHYVGASITYDLNPKQVVVDKEQIVDWLSWDNNFNVTFHEEPAREFMSDFMAKYSTLGTTRTFTNPLGMEAEVESHFFGWCLDEETEVEAFLSNIRNGETAYREPAHFTRGSFQETGEWGDTFIQVCLTTQHMWYFENGELMLENPIVTGMAGRSQTPPGIFEILWMASPTVLRGPVVCQETGRREWESPVSYWMAITWCGIGFHDATWQPYFGGNRWTYGGSRGCINMPLGPAGELYRMVGEGTMSIVHW